MGTVHPRRRGGSRPSARAGRASEGRGKERAEYYERTRGAGADSRRARRRGAHRPGARTGTEWGGAARPRSPPDDDSRARRLPEERPPPARARPPPPPSPPPALPARPPAAAPSPSPASAGPAPRAPARPRPGRTEPSGGAAEVGRRQRSRTRQERCAPPAPPPLGGAGGGRRPTPRRLRAPGRTSWALRSCLRRRCSVRPGRAGTALRRWKETKPLLPPSPAPPPSCRREDEGDLPPAAFLFRRLSLAPCRPQRFSNWAAPTRAVARVVYVTVPASSAPIGWGEGYISGGRGWRHAPSPMTSFQNKVHWRVWPAGGSTDGASVRPSLGATCPRRRNVVTGHAGPWPQGPWPQPSPCCSTPLLQSTAGKSSWVGFFPNPSRSYSVILFWDSRTARYDKCTPNNQGRPCWAAHELFSSLEPHLSSALLEFTCCFFFKKTVLQVKKPSCSPCWQHHVRSRYAKTTFPASTSSPHVPIRC